MGKYAPGTTHSFALMEIDMIALLLMVSAYLFVHGFAIYYRIQFDKEM